ncbi:hypothetical protein [Paracoccus xiamenensis]|uniref:hypothetical protein n=1 Tax=Paracoccus xiamenensis TaxID=2714901 RepID=UPI00140B7167|nr:hypothetical protein [Paracoccus xiamenensis]NHF73858.1 hypothetical protein [Paracoccus xiamenensis]
MFRAPSPKAVGAAVLAAALGLAQSAAAQDSAAPSGDVLLELNGLTDSEGDSCTLTFLTTNRLQQGLQRAAWQVAIFDADGAVKLLPVLDFGALIAGKTRVIPFVIPGGQCASIGRIVVNDVIECTAEGGGDLRTLCLANLTTQNRSSIEFGI